LVRLQVVRVVPVHPRQPAEAARPVLRRKAVAVRQVAARPEQVQVADADAEAARS